MKKILSALALLVVMLISAGAVSAEVLLSDSFESPEFKVSDANNAQDHRQPDGWIQTCCHGSYVSILSENYVNPKGITVFSTTYGSQAVELYFNPASGVTAMESTSQVLDAVLEEGKEYVLSFNVAGRVDTGSKGAYLVELVAGNTVLASAEGYATTNDMSESDSIVFVADASHASLIGQPLKVRFKQSPNRKHYSHKPVYDNVMLTAESLCTVTQNNGCDGVDNDCDGAADEADESANLGTSCNSGLPGICADGTIQCSGNYEICIENTQPGSLPEIVGNSLDEDCDGIAVCDSSANWKNHGQYVACVAKETGNKAGEVPVAAQSITGKVVEPLTAEGWLGATSVIAIISLVIVTLGAFKMVSKK